MAKLEQNFENRLQIELTGTKQKYKRETRTKEKKDSVTNYTAHTASDLIGYKPSFQLLDGPSPGAWSDIWLVSLARIILAKLSILSLTQFMNRDIRLIASAILFVSLSAVGADKFDEPKLLKSKAKKRFST